MRKVVNGKVYNTDTAVRIGMWDNGYEPEDPLYYSEELYKKPNGYFLYCVGGAMSVLSQLNENNERVGMEEIVVFTLEGAKDWAIKNMNRNEYEMEFEFVELLDWNRKKNVTLYLSERHRYKMRKEAGIMGLTLGQYIEKLYEKYIQPK